MKLEYQIVNVCTVARKPGVIYASVTDSQGHVCVTATLDYCVGWIKQNAEKFYCHSPLLGEELLSFAAQSSKSHEC